MEKFNYDNLLGIVGSKAKVSAEQGETELTIDAVERTSLHGNQWDAFCVVLKGSAECPLMQGTYTLKHDAFDSVELLISPNSSTEYEIHVSRKIAN